MFAIHPIFATLPIWIPGRNDTLITIFVLLSFIELVRYIELKKIVILSFLYHFLLYLCLHLFILYPLFLYCFNYNISKQEVIKISYCLFFIITIYLYLRSISVASISIKYYFINSLTYLKNIFFGLTNYCFFFFYPQNMPTMLYNENIKLLNTLIFAFISYFIVMFYLRNTNYRKIILFSVIWFLLFLFPTFLQREYVFLTHRLLLASISLAIVLSIVLDTIIKKYLILKKYIILLFGIIFINFAFISFKFENFFSSKNMYWKKAYIDAPQYHVVCYGLAQLYLSQGKYDKYKELIVQAYNLSTGDTHIFNIIFILLYEGKIDEAKQICFNILNDKEAKKFLVTGANKTLGNIYYNENNLHKSYIYFKSAYDLNKFDLESKNKLIEIENKINGK